MSWSLNSSSGGISSFQVVDQFGLTYKDCFFFFLVPHRRSKEDNILICDFAWRSFSMCDRQMNVEGNSR